MPKFCQAFIKARIRVINEMQFGPLPRLTILDTQIAKFTIGKPKVRNSQDYLTFWMESKAFALMLENYYNNLWDNSVPLTDLIEKR